MGITRASTAQTPHIVYAFDQGFALCSVVSAFSLLQHRDGPTRLSLLMNAEITGLDVAVAALKRAFPKADINILIRPELKAEAQCGLPPASYFRLALPTLFTGRLIYLDGDVLVRRDIDALFQADLAGKAFGAVIDTVIERNLLMVKMRLKSAKRWDPTGRFADGRPMDMSRYINSGVMVMDLDRAAADPGAGQLFDIQTAQDFASENTTLFADQDWINHVGRDHIHLLGPEWNAIWGNARARFPLPRARRRALAQSQTDPAIVHYAGGQKPWLPGTKKLRKSLRRWDQEYRAVMAEMHKRDPELLAPLS